MKKTTFLAMSSLLLGAFSYAQTYQNDTPTPPTDGVSRLSGCGFGTDPGVQMNEITVPLVGDISDPTKITVNLSLSAGWLGDVVVDLVSPAGEAITLIRRIGATGNGSCGDSSSFIPANILSFNSTNPAVINASAVGVGIPIPAGNYLPSLGAAPYPVHSPADMTTFLTGRKLNGTWRLIVYDYGLGEPTILNSWQMVIGTGALKTGETGTFGSELSLKKNPVDEYLMLNITEQFKTLQFEIYDVSGKMIKKENMLNSARDLQIDVRNLTPGMYILNSVRDGERLQPIKFIKK